MPSPWWPLVFRCKWSRGQMVYPAMEGLYPTKFVSWGSPTGSLCPGRWCFVPPPESLFYAGVDHLFTCTCKNSLSQSSATDVGACAVAGLSCRDQAWGRCLVAAAIISGKRIPVAIFSRRRSPFPTNIFSLRRGTEQLTSIAAYLVFSINKNCVLSFPVR
jgi:hypothetical protein